MVFISLSMLQVNTFFFDSRDSSLLVSFPLHDYLLMTFPNGYKNIGCELLFNILTWSIDIIRSWLIEVTCYLIVTQIV